MVLVLIASTILFLVSRTIPIIDFQSPMGVVLLVASFSRLGRMLAFDGIFRWLRALVGLIVIKDETAAGECEAPRLGLSGFRLKIAELFTCPICSGTWGIISLLTINSIDTRFATILLIVFGVSGFGELLSWLSEFGFWIGRLTRVIDGIKENNYD